MRTRIALALAAVIAIAIFAIRNLATGHVPRPSLLLVAIVIFCVAGLVRYKQTALRLAFAMAGAEAAIRLALWLAHVRTRWQWAAAVGGEIVLVLVAIIVIVVILEWLRSTGRGQPPANREKSAS